MLFPLALLAVLTILLGLFPNPLASYIRDLAVTLLRGGRKNETISDGSCDFAPDSFWSTDPAASI